MRSLPTTHLSIIRIYQILYTKTKIDLNSASQQIIIEPEMLVNEMAIGNIDKLADEQIIVKNNIFPNISNYWDFKESNLANSWHYPLSAVIDLGNYYNINSIAIYNQSAVSANITIYFNNQAFQNLDSMTTSLDTAYKWKIFNKLNYEQIKYLRIKTNSPNTKIGEIYLWGSIQSNIQDSVSINYVDRKYPLMKDFIDINGTTTNPLENLIVQVLLENITIGCGMKVWVLITANLI